MKIRLSGTSDTNIPAHQEGLMEVKGNSARFVTANASDIQDWPVIDRCPVAVLGQSVSVWVHMSSDQSSIPGDRWGIALVLQKYDERQMEIWSTVLKREEAPFWIETFLQCRLYSMNERWDGDAWVLDKAYFDELRRPLAKAILHAWNYLINAVIEKQDNVEKSS